VPLLAMLVLGWLYEDVGASAWDLDPALTIPVGFVVYTLVFLGVGFGSRSVATMLAEDWLESHSDEPDKKTLEQK
jgi:hypothetical protein